MLSRHWLAQHVEEEICYISLKGNNNYTCAVQGVLGVVTGKSVKLSLQLRLTDFRAQLRAYKESENHRIA